MASFKRIVPRPQVEADPLKGRLFSVAETDEHRQTRITQSEQGPKPATLCLATGAQIASLPVVRHAAAVTIGRDAKAVVTLNDQYASRIHAYIKWDAKQGMHVITDAGSGNGTYINGVRISGPLSLLDGTRIRIGRTNLVYRRAVR